MPKSIRVEPIGPLRGALRVPGDKSISHRALICNALAAGEARMTNLLDSADCRATIACLAEWGVECEADGDVLIVRSPGAGAFRTPAATLDCGNSGTTMRLLAGVAAGLPFVSRFDGDESLRQRPMGRVLQPLSAMGAMTEGADGGTRAPFSVGGRPGGLSPFRGELAVASAQVKSAMVFAALAAAGESRIVEPGPSRDHTERMLSAMGAQIAVDGAAISVRPGAQLQPRDVVVPGDISAAAFWIAAAAVVPDSDLRLPAVGVNPRRTGVIDALRAMGARIDLEAERTVGGEPVADLRVRAAPLRGTAIDGDLIVRALDELPVLAVAAACAEGATEIRDAAELRVKESDRIASTAAMLRAFGARVVEWEDGMRIVPQGGLDDAGGAVVESVGDHRIAMAAAVGALAASGGAEIRGAEAVDISYPRFWDDLERLRGAAESVRVVS